MWAAPEPWRCKEAGNDRHSSNGSSPPRSREGIDRRCGGDGVDSSRRHCTGGSVCLLGAENVRLTVSNSANWQTILTLTVPAHFLAGHGHACQAVASLDANNPGGDLVSQYYFFTITQNNANPFVSANGVERTIELRNQAGVNDLDFLPVSTNTVFGFTANVPQVIRLLGRKSAGAPNLLVDDGSLSIMCI